MKISRSFLESLAVAAAGAALFLVGVTEPRFGPLAGFFTPAAFLWSSLRLNPTERAFSVIVAAAHASPFLSSLPSVLSLITGSAVPALFLGTLLRRGRGVVSAGLAAAAAAIFLSLLASFWYFSLAGLDAVTFLWYQAGDLLREMEWALEGVSRSNGAFGSADIAPVMGFVTSAMPSLLFLTILSQFSVNALAVTYLLQRSGSQTFPTPSLSRYTLPDPLIWVFMFSLALLWAPLSALHTVSLNAVLILLYLYLLQGLSVFIHFLNRGRVSRPLRMMLFIAVLLQPYLLIVPLLAGLVDFRFDLRRLRSGLPAEP